MSRHSVQFSGPPEPEFKADNARKAIGRRIKQIEYGEQSLPDEVHQAEAMVFWFDDGSLWEVFPGSNATNLCDKFHKSGMKPKDFSIDLMVFFSDPTGAAASDPAEKLPHPTNEEFAIAEKAVFKAATLDMIGRVLADRTADRQSVFYSEEQSSLFAIVSVFRFWLAEMHRLRVDRITDIRQGSPIDWAFYPCRASIFRDEFDCFTKPDDETLTAIT